MAPNSPGEKLDARVTKKAKHAVGLASEDRVAAHGGFGLLITARPPAMHLMVFQRDDQRNPGAEDEIFLQTSSPAGA